MESKNVDLIDRIKKVAWAIFIVWASLFAIGGMIVLSAAMAKALSFAIYDFHEYFR